jgi:4-hydroxy-4-methyl-2-oxoglutarate aldolase
VDVSGIDSAESLTQRLSRAYTGAVYDVLRGRGIRDTILPKDIVPLDTSLTMAGPVFTMRGRSSPSADAHQTLLAWTDFLGRAPAGHIVVCEGNDPDRALMGELSAETLQKRGVAGFVTDGGCRDCGFIQSIRFPVFSRYRTPRDVVGAWMPEAFDVPLTIGAIEVHPGDYLIADIDGAVLIPGSIAGEVVDEVEKVMNTENLVRKAILAGVPPQEAYLRYGKF